MADATSPRASKRLKLTPGGGAAAASSPAATATPARPGTLKRPTRRAASHAKVMVAGSPDAESPFLTSPAIASTGGASARKRGARAEETDIYDDFAGALEGETSSRRLRSRLSGAVASSPVVERRGERGRVGADVEREEVDGAADAGAEVEEGMSSAKGNLSRRISVGRRRRGDVQVDREEAPPDAADDEEDELSTAPVTPSRRKRGARRAVSPVDEVKADANTPSKRGGQTRKGVEEVALPRRPSRRKNHEDAAEGETEKEQDGEQEEDANATSPSTRISATKLTVPRSARSRRLASQIDNTANGDVQGAGYDEGEHMVNGADDVKDVRSPGEDDQVHTINGTGGSSRFEETSPFYRSTEKSKRESTAAVSVEIGQDIDVAGSEDALAHLKQIVLEKLTGKRPIPLTGLDDEYSKVHQLVEHTIAAGEGNSILLIGARGSAKTALVKKVLAELAKDHREEFHIIRLNGFIHTDDKVALREIWRQLGKEMEVEDDTLGKNYADTLSTLLALLSHPSELAGQESDQVAKAVIFIMDEFDLFASHPRQTLLYNLFDIAQSRKAPIAVLGLTTRIDVADSLEKRVKSRFSHRYVHLSLAKSFTAFQEVCKAALQVHPDELSLEERALLSRTIQIKTPKMGRKILNSKDANILTLWNDRITSLFANSNFITTRLAPHYHRTKSVPAVLTSFTLPLSLLPAPHLLALTASNFSTPESPFTALDPPDSKLHLLPSLSDLALALLIAAARLDVVLDTDTCNFNMAYAEYVSLASKARIAASAGGALAIGTKVWGKEVARREWERLLHYELLIPVLGGRAGAGTGAGDMVRCDVALEEIAPAYGAGMDRVMERWCRQI